MSSDTPVADSRTAAEKQQDNENAALALDHLHTYMAWWNAYHALELAMKNRPVVHRNYIDAERVTRYALTDMLWEVMTEPAPHDERRFPTRWFVAMVIDDAVDWERTHRAARSGEVEGRHWLWDGTVVDVRDDDGYCVITKPDKEDDDG